MLSPELWLLASIPIVLGFWRSRYVWPALELTSVLRFVAPSSVWNQPLLGKFLSRASTGETLLYKGTCLSLVLATVWICLRLQTLGWTRRRCLSFAIGIFFGTLCTAPFLEHLGWLKLITAGYVSIYRSLLWPLVVVILNRDQFERFDNRRLIALLSPVWTYLESNFIPLTPLWLTKHFTNSASSPPKKANLESAGLRLLIVTGLVYLISRFLDYWAFGIGPSPLTWTHFTASLNYDGLFDSFMARRGWETNTPAIFVGFIALTVRLFLIFAITGGLSVSVARMCGFDLPAAVDRPYLATSLSNFYFRMMRYYGEVLMRVFYPLMKRLTPSIKNLKMRFAFRLFLTIFLGGFTYHFLHYLTLFYGMMTPYLILAQYTNSLPYFLSVAIAVACSTLLPSKNKLRHPLWQASAVAMYFFIITTLYSLDFMIVHDRKTWSDFFKLWSSAMSFF